MKRNETDAAVRRLAARQHGVFSLAQLDALGVGRGTPKRRVDQGEWQRLCRTVFALTGSPPTWLRDLKAAELSLPGSALIGRAAFHLYRLPAGRPCAPTVVAGLTASARNDLARVVRSRRLFQTRLVEGIRVVSPDEALLHAASFLGGLELERNLDEAMLRGLVGIRHLDALLDLVAGGRQPGIALLRPLVAERRPGWVLPESQLESRLRQVLRRADLPPVDHQVHFPWLPAARGRVDAAIPAWRLILEADGRHWHARSTAFEADRLRDNLAMANGYGVMRFTHFQLKSCPAEVIALIEQAGRWRQAS